MGAVLRDPETRRLIDLTKPTAVLMVGILPYIHDEPAGVVARYRAALCEGSILALTHLTKDVEPELVDNLVSLSARMDGLLVPRSKQDVEEFVCGLKLLEPGLVLAAHWRADGGCRVPRPPRKPPPTAPSASSTELSEKHVRTNGPYRTCFSLQTRMG